MNVAEILEAAAKLIEETGWWDGHTKMDKPSNCVVTAISRVHRSQPTYEYLVRYLKLEGKRTTAFAQRVVEWNDSKGQTKKKVLAAMRKAAAVWRKEHGFPLRP